MKIKKASLIPKRDEKGFDSRGTTLIDMQTHISSLSTRNVNVTPRLLPYGFNLELKGDLPSLRFCQASTIPGSLIARIILLSKGVKKCTVPLIVS
jgi:hypothetical protein